MSSQNKGSVTGWIEDLKAQDPGAQEKIWSRFVDRLVRHANRKLRCASQRVVDAEDIANMAFANFFQKSPGEFEKLFNREDLWQILAMLVERRAIDQIRKESAKKNGGGMIVNEDVLAGDFAERANGLDNLPGKGTPIEFDMMLAEELELRLGLLPEDSKHRQVAIEKLQGYNNREIADRLAMGLRSVERKLEQIRDIFKSSLTNSNSPLGT